MMVSQSNTASTSTTSTPSPAPPRTTSSARAEPGASRALPYRILVCDDEKLSRWSLTEHLKKEGYQAESVEDGEHALASIRASPPDALVMDVRTSKLGGMSVLRRLREQGSTLPVVVITAHGAVDAAIDATKLGAAAYVSKPLDLRELSLQLEKVLENHRLEIEARYLRQRATSGYDRLVGESPAMKRVFETLQRLEKVDAPTVLIRGESGTGKDLVAQAIHARGPRKDKPYMEIDCAAMQETLIESELFGHEKGSFTDAHTTKKGLFEVADGGVIFLDEIGEMTAGTQAKLLRALENRRFKRVGGVTEIPLDAAIIAATHRDLREEVKAGRFREDLFFRLNVVPIDIAPLRERREDIEPLARALVERTAQDLRRKIPGIDEDAMAALHKYAWPGNVRELRNVIERVVILKQEDDFIHLRELPEEVRQHRAAGGTSCPYELPFGGVDLAAVERGLVTQALQRCHGNQTRAAKLLGISRFALRHRIDRYGLGDVIKAA